MKREETPTFLPFYLEYTNSVSVATKSGLVNAIYITNITFI
jgi:nitrate reductase assembly molybdenum cofactor insertion protein NarJ